MIRILCVAASELPLLPLNESTWLELCHDCQAIIATDEFDSIFSRQHLNDIRHLARQKSLPFAVFQQLPPELLVYYFNKNRTLPGDIPPVSGQVNAPLLFIGDIRIGEIELSTDAPDEVKLHLFFNDKEIPLSQASYGIQKMNLRADGEVERVQLEELLPDVGQTMLAESAQQGSSIIPPNAETLSNQSGVVHNPLPWAIPFMQHPETILHRTALINDDPLHYFITSRDCNEDFVKTLFSIAYHDNENDNPLRKPKPTVAAYPPDKWFELHEQLTLVNSEIGILQRLDSFVKERMATIDQDIRGIDKAKTDLQTELRSQADRDDGTRKSVATVTEITALGEKIQQFANHLAILEECAANLDNADSVLVPLISSSPSLNEQNETLIAIQNYLFALFSRCAELETALDEIEFGSAGLVFCDSLTQDERTDTLRAAFLNLGLYNPQVKIDKRIVELRQKFADVTSALDQIRQRKTDIVDEAWGSRQKQLEIYHQFSQLLQQYRKTHLQQRYELEKIPLLQKKREEIRSAIAVLKQNMMAASSINDNTQFDGHARENASEYLPVRSATDATNAIYAELAHRYGENVIPGTAMKEINPVLQMIHLNIDYREPTKGIIGVAKNKQQLFWWKRLAPAFSRLDLYFVEGS
jgi:uncharacterized coiled-coil DUF342 family protein